MMTDAAATSHDLPVHRLLWMPWCWHRWGWRALAVAVLLWLMVYVAAYPIVETWQGYGAFHQVPFLDEALAGAYFPLCYFTENFDLCFSWYVWELRWIAGSEATAWMLPEPIAESEIYPWVPNAD